MISPRVTGVAPLPGIPSKRGSGIKVAKARTLVGKRDLLSKAWNSATRKSDEIEKPHARTMALDLSVRKIGAAWGVPGQLPEGTRLILPPIGEECEALQLSGLAEAVRESVQSLGCEVVIFSEFYSPQGALSFRANCSLRGAVMTALASVGIIPRPIAEISARKAAGVDVSKKKDDEKKGYMKVRARARLEELGLGHLGEDQGDAAILLLGAKDLIEKE